jgi:hypothetical protein
VVISKAKNRNKKVINANRNLKNGFFFLSLSMIFQQAFFNKNWKLKRKNTFKGG